MMLKSSERLRSWKYEKDIDSIIAVRIYGNAVFASDYMAEMIQAATQGNYEWGEAAEQARNEKIDSEGLDYGKISFDELYRLARQVYIEAGCSWISDEHQRMVATVVMNRVESDLFPDTVYGVLTQRGQYAYRNLNPDERAVRNALVVLEGHRALPSGVVYQSNFPQGSGVYLSIYDRHLGTTTYFCWRVEENG